MTPVHQCEFKHGKCVTCERDEKPFTIRLNIEDRMDAMDKKLDKIQLSYTQDFLSAATFGLVLLIYLRGC